MSFLRRSSTQPDPAAQPADLAPRVPRVGVIPISDFYDQDERRRPSREKRLGMDWRDVDGHRFELSWIEDTGELYLMSESDWTFIPGPGAYYSAAVAKPQALVIATIPSEVEVDSLLKGWRDAMNVSLGVGWVMDRIDGRADSTI